MFKKYRLELRNYYLVIIAKNKDEVIKLMETLGLYPDILRIDIQSINKKDKGLIDKSIIPPFVAGYYQKSISSIDVGPM